MPKHENIAASIPSHESNTPLEQAAPEVTRREAGKRVLFRVMNLDNHEGVQSRAEDGTVTYTVDNQQYPDQGDFAFGHEETGFQDATTRAYPRNLHNVHAVEVDPVHVVEPYPEEAPGLVYIKNGATVTAKPVPQERIDAYIADPDAVPGDISRQIADEMFSSRTQ